MSEAERGDIVRVRKGGERFLAYVEGRQIVNDGTLYHIQPADRGVAFFHAREDEVEATWRRAVR